PQDARAEEALYKAGMFSSYILRDTNSALNYFETLRGKEIPTVYSLSSIYQLGVMYQWKAEVIKAKEYYTQLLEHAGEESADIISKAQERMREIEQSAEIKYSLKSFLDLSWEEENASFDMTKVDLSVSVPQFEKNQEISFNAVAFVGETGCMPVAFQYLWSGNLGTTTPAPDASTFTTVYSQAGTKEVCLVVVLPSGTVDRAIQFVDVR
ncbi:MAG: hypothetical protein KKC84_06795, partial [Candidatus Omnitrophica bacterium]|nr:hypothetical protein [Candidatus Omnitrophota bacterium]